MHYDIHALKTASRRHLMLLRVTHTHAFTEKGDEKALQTILLLPIPSLSSPSFLVKSTHTHTQ